MDDPPLAVQIDQARSRRSDALRNRASVLAAAQRLFAAQGLDAQVPDLARAANVGVGTVYRHFASKDELIWAFVAAHFDRLAEKARECLEMGDTWAAVAEFIRFSSRLQAGDRGLCEASGSRPAMMGAAAVAAGLPELLERLVKRAQRAGTLRPDLSWEDIPTIVCALGGASQQANGLAAGRWPRVVEIIIDGLRAPGGARLPRALVHEPDARPDPVGN